MVTLGSQKASEDKKAMLKVEIHPSFAVDESRAGLGTEADGTRRLTSESTRE